MSNFIRRNIYNCFYKNNLLSELLVQEIINIIQNVFVYSCEYGLINQSYFVYPKIKRDNLQAIFIPYLLKIIKLNNSKKNFKSMTNEEIQYLSIQLGGYLFHCLKNRLEMKKENKKIRMIKYVGYNINIEDPYMIRSLNNILNEELNKIDNQEFANNLITNKKDNSFYNINILAQKNIVDNQLTDLLVEVVNDIVSGKDGVNFLKQFYKFRCKFNERENDYDKVITNIISIAPQI